MTSKALAKAYLALSPKGQARFHAYISGRRPPGRPKRTGVEKAVLLKLGAIDRRLLVLEKTQGRAAPPVDLNRPKVLRLGKVMELVGLSRTTIWRLEREGKFPKRINLGMNSVGWMEADVLAWLRSPRT